MPYTFILVIPVFILKINEYSKIQIKKYKY